MSKTTIFGEEHFIDKAMINIIEDRGNAIDNIIYNEIAGVAKYELKMPKIIINKDKVKKWLILCSQLENIEHSELVDMATKKRIADLEAKLAESEKEKNYYQDLYFTSVKGQEKLKQQLAEKERKIKGLGLYSKNVIDYAIEKLQETKKDLRDKVCLMENDEHCYPQNAIHWQDVVAIIDNQIKELKESQ